MTAGGNISFLWGDGEHRFALLLGQIRELQDNAGCGPHVLYERLFTHQWRVDDLSEILRLGLIGGGMSPVDAAKLVARYCYPERPMVESVKPAIAVLAAALIGVPDDPVTGTKSGKTKAAKGKKRAGSPSPQSMAPAAQ
tara:strand:+ start:816 stop:1232 length:417 start_codon:yes stop_codon:yes gene_type:complete